MSFDWRDWIAKKTLKQIQIEKFYLRFELFCFANLTKVNDCVSKKHILLITLIKIGAENTTTTTTTTTAVVDTLNQQWLKKIIIKLCLLIT